MAGAGGGDRLHAVGFVAIVSMMLYKPHEQGSVYLSTQIKINIMHETADKDKKKVVGRW